MKHKNLKDRTISFRTSSEIANVINIESKKHGISQSQFINDALTSATTYKEVRSSLSQLTILIQDLINSLPETPESTKYYERIISLWQNLC